jgi:Concanavalin A-like lectin/glucanases superfamily
MNTIQDENGRSWKIGFRLARTIIVAGLLFGATSGLAQLSPPTQPTNAPLASWSFQDPTNWTSDQGFAPISFTNIALSYMGDGASLVVDTNVPAWLQYYVYEPTNAATNLTVDTGSVTFWFAPDWASTNQGGTGPGERGTLFEAGSFTPDSSYGWWSIYVGAGGNNIYFSTQTNDLSSNFWIWVSAPISWTTNYFHFVVLTYSPTNTALYLDGVLATNGPPLTVYPGLNALTNGLWIGSSSNGLNQSHGMFDWVATFNYPLDSNDIAAMFNWYYPNYIIDPYNADYMQATNGQAPFYYGTNLSLYPVTVTNNLASLFVVNSSADILYEIQGTTNLARPNWFSEGFVDGSELTNLTMANVTFLGGGNSSLFLRVRSWIDTTGTGIPDWWWLEYFGQTTNVNAYASAANDGFDNLYKFQNNLNPTNYYNPNPVPNFFGCLDATGTNVILEWSNAPGPVTGYVIQRGTYNDSTYTYDYVPIGEAVSNATYFEDVGANTNNAAQNDAYTVVALYPGGASTPTNTWYWTDRSPVVGNVYGYADATGTNVLLSWTPAEGMATNYLIERGVYNTTNYDYDFYPIGQVGSNATNYEVTGILTNAGNWGDEYGVVAAYPGGGLSWLVPSGFGLPAMGISPVKVGATNGLAAVTNFYGYTDGAGNAYLNWSAASGNVTNYLIYGGNYNSDSGDEIYSPLATVNAGTTNFELTGNPYALYAAVAAYSDTNLSQAATWDASLGTPGPGALVAYVDSTGTNIMLAWSAVPGATGYVIEKSTDYGADYYQISSTGSGTTTFEDTGGNSGDLSAIMYEVQATYPNGGMSSAVSTTVATDPPAPTNLSVSVNRANAVLTWTPVLTPGVTYTIERGVYNPATGTYSYTQVGQVSTTSFTDTGAINGNSSYNNAYEVIASYPGGQTSIPVMTMVSQTALPPAQTNMANFSVTANLVRNQTGNWELVFSGISTNIQAVALYWYQLDNFY